MVLRRDSAVACRTLEAEQRMDGRSDSVVFLPARGVGLGPVLLALKAMYGRDFDLPHDGGRYAGGGLVACSGDELTGLAIWVEAAVADSGKKSLFLYGGTMASWRGRGVGASLVRRALKAARAECESGELIASLAPTEVTPINMSPVPRGLWRQLDFELMDVQVTWQCCVTPQPPESTGSLYRASTYTGGDDARDAAIVDVTNRMLAKRAGIPFWTLEDLHHQVCRDDSVLLLIDCGSRLAATASLIITGDNCYVETLVVDRPFWGRGTSDALGRTLTRLAHERGCRTINALAAKTNTGIQSLMRRFGWEPVCETMRLRRCWP